MSWLYLLLAGLFEIGWPVGLKISQMPETRWMGIAIAIFFMTLSGVFLWLAQREIPIGTAYAIWTGIGAAGTFMTCPAPTASCALGTYTTPELLVD